MRAIVTAVVAAIEGCAAAVAGLAVIAIPAVLLWVVTFSIAAEPEVVAAAAAGVWLLAHFVPMQFSLPQEAMLTMGLGSEALTFSLSLAPLAVTLISVMFAVRAGARLSRRGGIGSAGLIGGALGFAAVALGAASVADPFIGWPVWGAVGMATLVYLAAAAVAYTVSAAMAGSHWWLVTVRGMQRGLEYLGVHGGIAAFPARAAQTTRLVVGSLAGMVGLAAVALTVALAAGFADVIALAQALQLDPLGSLLLFLTELAMLPTGVIWALAWLSGAGFSAGGEFSPFADSATALPSLPLFGALPADWGSLGAVAPVLVVLVTLAVGLLLTRNSELRRGSWATALTLPMIAAVVTGLAVAGLCVLGSGSLGPGRMAALGPDPWLVGAWVSAECAAGLLLGITAVRLDYSRLSAAIPLPEPIARWSAERATTKARAAANVRPEDAETVDLSRVRDDLTDASEQDTAPVIDLFASVLHEPALDTETPADSAPDSLPEIDSRADTGALEGDPYETERYAIDLNSEPGDAAHGVTEPAEAAPEPDEVFDIEVAEADAAETTDLTSATKQPTDTDAQELEDAEAIARAFAWDQGESTTSPGDTGVSGLEGGAGKVQGKFHLPGWRGRRDKS